MKRFKKIAVWVGLDGSAEAHLVYDEAFSVFRSNESVGNKWLILVRTPDGAEFLIPEGSIMEAIKIDPPS